MSIPMMTLTVICGVICLFSLGYTLAVARGQKELKGEVDTSIPQKVKGGVYTRNPVFIGYLLFFLLLILTITFFMLSTNWP